MHRDAPSQAASCRHDQILAEPSRSTEQPGAPLSRRLSTAKTPSMAWYAAWTLSYTGGGGGSIRNHNTGTAKAMWDNQGHESLDSLVSLCLRSALTKTIAQQLEASGPLLALRFPAEWRTATTPLPPMSQVIPMLC